MLRLARFSIRRRVYVNFFFAGTASPRFPLKIDRPCLAMLSNAHRGDGKRFIVRADEKVTTFLERERITYHDSHRNPTALLSFRGARGRACVPREKSGS
ncbi:MAG: hypothetical protein DME33_11005 [Verrucomicrobia bacterium]|nr:MAG: hypothetical protein DME33_11005 [Verrucomicrobiota bacterium]